MRSLTLAAFLVTAAASLAACALPPRRLTSSPAADCVAEISSRVGCSADPSPDTSAAFHDPAMGMDMPTHPH